MGKAWFLVWVLVVGVLLEGQSGMAKFVVEKKSPRMMSPDSIKGTYDSVIGNFEIPEYGGTMVGTVTYPKDNTNRYKSFDTFDISFKSKPSGLPTVLVLNREGCSIHY